MKILSQKKYQQLVNENKSLKKMNKYLCNGYRALSISLDFEKAIIGIMETLGVNEVEIEESYFISKKYIETMKNEINNKITIRIKED